MPRVSIGMPVYNGENFVAQAIASVSGQSFDDWELVISDNASTDRTREICELAASEDPRIRFYRAEVNRGAAWNFNRVFELSQGEYFRWLSHDDLLAPAAIATCLETMLTNPNLTLCASSTAVIDENGHRVLDAGDSASDLRFQGLNAEQEARRRQLSASKLPHERYRGILLDSLRCYEIYGLMRRDVMAQTQLHPAYCGGEKVLLAELALLGPFCELPDVLFFCRWHAARFTSNNSARQQNEHMSPGRARRLALPHQYRATLGYLQLIPKIRMPLVERVRCLYVWLRFTLQARKWRSILHNTLTGKATSATIELPTQRGDCIIGPQEHATSLRVSELSSRA